METLSLPQPGQGIGSIRPHSESHFTNCNEQYFSSADYFSLTFAVLRAVTRRLQRHLRLSLVHSRWANQHYRAIVTFEMHRTFSNLSPMSPNLLESMKIVIALFLNNLIAILNIPKGTINLISIFNTRIIWFKIIQTLIQLSFII